MGSWTRVRDRSAAGFIYAGATFLFVLASMTDWLDGYLARKLNAVTPLGAALDHCADKVLIACVMLALAYAAFPMQLVIAAMMIIARDIAVAGLREGLSASGRALPVSWVGKWKAAAEMAGVAVFLAFQSAAMLSDSVRVIMALDWSARILLWVAAGSALVSARAIRSRGAKPKTNQSGRPNSTMFSTNITRNESGDDHDAGSVKTSIGLPQAELLLPL